MGATKMVVAKFEVGQISQFLRTRYDEKLQRSVPNGVQIQVHAHPVCGEVNKSWASASPGGELKLTIDNPAAQEMFKPGMFLYIEMREAPYEDTPEELARLGLKG